MCADNAFKLFLLPFFADMSIFTQFGKYQSGYATNYTIARAVRDLVKICLGNCYCRNLLAKWNLVQFLPQFLAIKEAKMHFLTDAYYVICLRSTCRDTKLRRLYQIAKMNCPICRIALANLEEVNAHIGAVHMLQDRAGGAWHECPTCGVSYER